VDFVKMHPGFFDAVDRLVGDVRVSVWGNADDTVTVRARAMLHPERIVFCGETKDPQAALAETQMRRVERTQRVECSERKPRPEIFPGLSHAHGDRAAPLHDQERVDRPIGARGMAGAIPDRALQPFDEAVLPAFRRRPGIVQAGGRGS